MSKGYILVDVPEKCSQCNFWFAKATEPVECRCMAKQRKLQNLTEKPDWCPIRELPEKRRVMGVPRNPSIGDFERVAYQRGWNDCVEQMEVIDE